MSAFVYRQYLAITAIQRRLETVGGRLDEYIVLDESNFWRNRLAADPTDEGSRQNLMEFPEVRTRIDSGELVEEERNEIIDRLTQRYPDFVEFEARGNRCLYFEPLEGIGVQLSA